MKVRVPLGEILTPKVGKVFKQLSVQCPPKTDPRVSADFAGCLKAWHFVARGLVAADLPRKYHVDCQCKKPDCDCGHQRIGPAAGMGDISLATPSWRTKGSNPSLQRRLGLDVASLLANGAYA
jgi:hypothetical protein